MQKTPTTSVYSGCSKRFSMAQKIASGDFFRSIFCILSGIFDRFWGKIMTFSAFFGLKMVKNTGWTAQNAWKIILYTKKLILGVVDFSTFWVVRGEYVDFFKGENLIF